MLRENTLLTVTMFVGIISVLSMLELVASPGFQEDVPGVLS